MVSATHGAVPIFDVRASYGIQPAEQCGYSNTRIRLACGVLGSVL